MKKPTTISKESVSEYREFVQLRLRKRVLEAIEVVLEEEVNQALGCGSYERAEDRRRYRNGVLCQNSALLKDHGCNLMHRKVLVSFCQHLMVEAPMRSV